MTLIGDEEEDKKDGEDVEEQELPKKRKRRDEVDDLSLEERVPRPEGCRGYFWEVATSQTFQWFITTTIGFNVLIMIAAFTIKFEDMDTISLFSDYVFFGNPQF